MMIRALVVAALAFMAFSMRGAGPSSLHQQPYKKPKLAPSSRGTYLTLNPSGLPAKADAHATLTVQKSPEGDFFGYVDSKETDYAKNGSEYFVVDVIIPATFKMDHAQFIKIYASETAWQLAQSNRALCIASQTNWIVIKRKRLPNSRDFTYEYVQGEKKNGKWVASQPDVPSRCENGVSMGIRIPTPESEVRQATVYRVMVQAKVSGQFKQVRVSWCWSNTADGD